jgi:predicted Zn-dependent protease with MMP-like domain
VIRGFDSPSLDDFMVIANDALASLPNEMANLVTGVALHVADFPDSETLVEMGLDSPYDLLGLYSGVPFGEADGFVVRHDVNRIFLYRRPILAYWRDTGEPLDRIIRHVVIHEIGHHFGLSDDEMEALEAQAP